MKQKYTIAQLFPVVRQRLTQIQLDVEALPDKWHEQLQRAIDTGSFLKIELGFGLAGVVDCQLLLVSKKGEVTQVSLAGSCHA